MLRLAVATPAVGSFFVLGAREARARLVSCACLEPPARECASISFDDPELRGLSGVPLGPPTEEDAKTRSDDLVNRKGGDRTC
jgi:hypothetical protein